jgi:hypothetical protein
MVELGSFTEHHSVVKYIPAIALTK